MMKKILLIYMYSSAFPSVRVENGCTSPRCPPPTQPNRRQRLFVVCKSRANRKMFTKWKKDHSAIGFSLAVINIIYSFETDFDVKSRKFKIKWPNINKLYNSYNHITPNISYPRYIWIMKCKTNN